MTTGLVEGWSFTADPLTAMSFTLDAMSLKPTGNLDTDLEPVSQTPGRSTRSGRAR